MKIGIVSDTHRNRELLDKVAGWLISHEKIVSLYHLGDDFNDVADLRDGSVDLQQVPGIYEQGYKDGSLPVKLTETVMGLRILLVHARDKDLTSQDVTINDIITFGHTHKAEMTLEDGRLFFNPGHLKGARDKNIDPSFGMLDIQDSTVTASILDANCKVIQELQLTRSETGLYKS
jgi:putative phosphoesterase